MTLRPYPGLTIAGAILFCILCGLGAWQLERLQWKLALIARVNSHMAAAPLALDAILAMKGDDHRITPQLKLFSLSTEEPNQPFAFHKATRLATSAPFMMHMVIKARTHY